MTNAMLATLPCCRKFIKNKDRLELDLSSFVFFILLVGFCVSALNPIPDFDLLLYISKSKRMREIPENFVFMLVSIAAEA